MSGLLNRRTMMAGLAAACAAPGAGTALAGGREHRVLIKRFKFEPARLEVRPGDVIVWENLDIAPHTATATDKSWDTGRIITL